MPTTVFGSLLSEVCEMAMLLLVVEGQHPVAMLPGLDQLAQPEMGAHGLHVSDDQQIGIATGLGRVEHVLDPVEGFGDPALAAARWTTVPRRWAATRPVWPSDLAKRSAGWRLVHTSGAAQPLSAIQAVPRTVRSSSSAGIALVRRRQRADQFQPLVQVRDRFAQRQALERQLAGLLPERDRRAGAAPPACSDAPAARARCL